MQAICHFEVPSLSTGCPPPPATPDTGKTATQLTNSPKLFDNQIPPEAREGKQVHPKEACADVSCCDQCGPQDQSEVLKQAADLSWQKGRPRITRIATDERLEFQIPSV